MKYFGYPDPEKNIYSRPDLSLDKLKNSYLYMMEILELIKARRTSGCLAGNFGLSGIWYDEGHQ